MAREIQKGIVDRILKNLDRGRATAPFVLTGNSGRHLRRALAFRDEPSDLSRLEGHLTCFGLCWQSFDTESNPVTALMLALST
jgi:hypothetical protein